MTNIQESALRGMVRFGVITSVDKVNFKAKIKFSSSGETSEWLPLLKHTELDQTTNTWIPVNWLPETNMPAAALYSGVPNGHGIILGVI